MKLSVYSTSIYEGKPCPEFDVTVPHRIAAITVDGEEWVPRVYPDAYCGKFGCGVSKPQFKVGDFVRVKRVNPGIKSGPVLNQTGKVLSADSYQLGVEFPGFKDGHNLWNKTTGDHGWYFPPSHLELI